MENDRQSKIWCCMLYPDNAAHLNAINNLKKDKMTILMKHNAKFDSNGELTGKEHYHCIKKFSNPKWLSTYIKELNLDPDVDDHLFKTLKDIKFKRLNKYIVYLTHIQNDDKETYSYLDFEGGLAYEAVSICRDINKTNYDIFLEVFDEIKEIQNTIPESHIWTFNKWCQVLEERGFGVALFKNWTKCRDLIRDWIYY